MCSDYKDQHDKLDNLFSMMITSINRVDESIKNILGFSRNKKTEIKPEPLDIKQITFEIIDGLRFTKNNKEINYIVNIDSENIFYSDKSRITSIINNLISNAAKYQREKEPEPFIKFSFSINKSEASIIVEDNGEGIPKDMQTRIFDMFIRASVHSSGSGLGLYICREMVEKLGGNIQLISEPDKGSIFIVRLPILMPQTIQYADSPVYR
jgi:signal transduction histidine kinase